LVKDGIPRSDARVQALAEARPAPAPDPAPHLRHTAAALLGAAGSSDVEVQLILGQAETETSKRLYAHLLQGSGEDAPPPTTAEARLCLLGWTLEDDDMADTDEIEVIFRIRDQEDLRRWPEDPSAIGYIASVS
jgi:hypothetical protein